MKKVYVSLLLHGNMCYDRYTKQEIRAKFPLIYAAGIRALHRYPQVTAHVDLPGLTVLSLKHHAPWLLDEMRPLIARGQLVMVGCQYAASHALCADEESDRLAGLVTRRIQEDEFGLPVTAFFPQEIVFHPQQPRLLAQMGYRRLIVMPADWRRPRRVTGVDGTPLAVYPLNLRACRLDALEEYYDAQQDGDFVMAGGDFELLGNLDGVVAKLAELAERGKLIEWTTVERYDREVGLADAGPAPMPCGQGSEDQVDSPSFSRWVGDPEDMIWHGHAVTATEALRAAGFADLAARRHGLGEVDVPLAESCSALPDNCWDQHFEHVEEFPETEAGYLARDGAPTLLSRAWHQALIGLNSDASGWFPWSPRTRHRNLALRAAAQLAGEVSERAAAKIAQRLAAPAPAAGWLLACNPGPARTVELETAVEAPLAIAEAGGQVLPTAVLRGERGWSARAEVELPAYGYRLLALQAAAPSPPPVWGAGARVEGYGQVAELADDVLTVGELSLSVEPFRLSDPSGVAATEEVAPDWGAAATRVRQTLFGPELEVLTELAWAVWLRLTLGLRRDRVEVTAEIHVDLPRRIGHLGYDPAGLLLAFRGRPGQVKYDIPYATITHPNQARSFVAAQRFVALESEASFGLISLGGNQAFAVGGAEGLLAASLGASTQGRPDTRPECIVRPDGTGEHLITSGGDPFMGAYQHRFALVGGTAADVALAARRLRAPAPVNRVTPGGGDWPAAGSLLAIAPETVHVTAFRRETVVLNEIAGAAARVSCEGQSLELGPFGVAEAALAAQPGVPR
jgi:hypothetical protein